MDTILSSMFNDYNQKLSWSFSKLYSHEYIFENITTIYKIWNISWLLYCTFQNYDHRRNTNLNYKKIRTHTVYNHIIIIIYHSFEIQFLISFSLLMAADLKLYKTNSTWNTWYFFPKICMTICAKWTTIKVNVLQPV